MGVAGRQRALPDVTGRHRASSDVIGREAGGFDAWGCLSHGVGARFHGPETSETLTANVLADDQGALLLR